MHQHGRLCTVSQRKYTVYTGVVQYALELYSIAPEFSRTGVVQARTGVVQAHAVVVHTGTKVVLCCVSFAGHSICSLYYYVDDI